jgi:hypothetical protein
MPRRRSRLNILAIRQQRLSHSRSAILSPAIARSLLSVLPTRCTQSAFETLSPIRRFVRHVPVARDRGSFIVFHSPCLHLVIIAGQPPVGFCRVGVLSQLSCLASGPGCSSSIKLVFRRLQAGRDDVYPARGESSGWRREGRHREPLVEAPLQTARVRRASPAGHRYPICPLSSSWRVANGHLWR